MTDAPELLPCPFCGAASEYSTVPDEGQRNDYATVSCTGCGASMRELLHWTEGSGENFPALGAAWNRRAPDPRVAALVEAAKKLLVMIDALKAESGRGIDYGEEDAFRRGEWFDAEEDAHIEQARAAIAAIKKEVVND